MFLFDSFILPIFLETKDVPPSSSACLAILINLRILFTWVSISTSCYDGSGTFCPLALFLSHESLISLICFTSLRYTASEMLPSPFLLVCISSTFFSVKILCERCLFSSTVLDKPASSLFFVSSNFSNSLRFFSIYCSFSCYCWISDKFCSSSSMKWDLSSWGVSKGSE